MACYTTRTTHVFVSVYVDVSQTKQAILSVRLNAETAVERRWSIRVTQISCWSPGLGMCAVGLTLCHIALHTGGKSTVEHSLTC